MNQSSETGSARPHRPLRGQTGRSLLWTGGENFLNRILSLVTFVVLARLLTPYDYGVAAIAEIVALGLTLLSSAGFSNVLIQRKSVDDTDRDTVFWFGCALGLVTTAAMILLAVPLARAVNIPELRWVLVALAPTCLAVALTRIQAAQLQREFQFAFIARVSVVGNILASSIGISIALLGGGYWAITVQSGLVPVWISILYHIRSPFRPGRNFSWARLRELAPMSLSFLGVGALQYVATQSDKFFISRSLGAVTLGFYSVSYRAVNVVMDVVSKSIQVVALPAFSRVQHDPERLYRGYVSALRLGQVVTLPVFAFLVAVAPEVVSVLFGPKWLPAVPAMVALCFFGLFQTLLTYNNAVLQAVGRAGTVFRLSLVSTIAQVAAIAVAVNLGGATWVAITLAARALVMFLGTSVVIIRDAKGQRLLRPFTGAVGRPVVAVVPMVLACTLLGGWDALPSDLLYVATCAVVAPLVYLALLAAVGRRHLAELWSLLIGMRQA